MSEPPDSPPPEDAAFTAALYSRIRGESQTESDASTINSDDDDTMHAHQLSAQRNEYNLTMAFTPKGTVPPPAFVARIRERLQIEMQLNLTTTPQTDDHSDDTNKQSNIPDATHTSDAPSNQVVVKPTFHGFLARVETDLATQYDRIVQNDIPLLSSSTNSKWCTKLNALVASQAELTFKEKHSMTVEDACVLAQRMVDELVQGYSNYFDAENDILAVAKRYDALQDWVHKSKSLFKDTDSIKSESLPAFDAMIQQYFNNDTDSSTSDDKNTTDINVWTNKIKRAKKAWLDIQTQRHIVNRFQAIVGNTHTCKICFTQTVQTVLVPCGHTLCKVCATKVGQCPFCNTTFYSTQDVFFA